jgi:AraC family transcriptional regulator of adaptative response/methylated-DNA-[protein]-cysteine methyltransferase
MKQMSLNFGPSPQELKTASLSQDADYGGLCFVAAHTTGVFCRPACPAHPQHENVEVFKELRDVVSAGYRPCKQCSLSDLYGPLPDWAQRLIERIEATPSNKLAPEDWHLLGIAPEQAKPWFKPRFGMSLREYCSARRSAEAFVPSRARECDPALSSVPERDDLAAWQNFFAGVLPKKLRHLGQTKDIALLPINTPIGLMLAGAVKQGICLLEYASRLIPEQSLATIQQQIKPEVWPVDQPHLALLRSELNLYFSAQLQEFSVPVAPVGTEFQQAVWAELRHIPHGETIAYDTLAHRLDQPTALRAVAGANGQNRISIVIPCHRVIGKDGSLTGYGGGLWRKRLLIALEQTGNLPGRSGMAEMDS